MYRYFLLSFSIFLLFIVGVACSDDSSSSDPDNTSENKGQETNGNSERPQIEVVINNYGRTFPSGMDENNKSPNTSGRRIHGTIECYYGG